jgi:hypothetical protein
MADTRPDWRPSWRTLQEEREKRTRERPPLFADPVLSRYLERLDEEADEDESWLRESDDRPLEDIAGSMIQTEESEEIEPCN